MSENEFNEAMYDSFLDGILPNISLREYFDLDDFSRTYIMATYDYYKKVKEISKIVTLGLITPTDGHNCIRLARDAYHKEFGNRIEVTKGTLPLDKATEFFGNLGHK